MFNKVRAVVAAAAFTFASFANIGQPLALAPTYLHRLLWLIDQKFHDLAKEGYGQNSAVYACLRLLCDSVPEPPLIAYTQLPDGEPGDPKPWTDPLRQLVRMPNALMTEYDMLTVTVLHLGIVGRSHWYKERDRLGRIIALWPLRPDRVGPIYGSPADAEASGNAADGVLLGWSYHVPGSSNYIPIARDNVVTHLFPDPAGESGGMAEGLGPLQVLAAEVGADNEATRFVGAMVSNYGSPGLVLELADSIKNLEQAKIIKSSLMRQFGGANRGEPAVIDAGAKIAQIGFSLADLEFPALRMHTETRIAAAFGVPSILVGLEAGIKQGVQATIDEMRDHFTETTLSAYWRRLSDTLTNALCNDPIDTRFRSIILRFDTGKVRAFAQQDEQHLAQITEGFKDGALTINEYREELGFAPRPDGDCYIYGIARGTGMQRPIPAGDTAPEQINLDHATNPEAVKQLQAEAVAQNAAETPVAAGPA